MKQNPTIRPLIFAAALAVLAAGCGDDNPVAPDAPEPQVQFAIDLNADVVVNDGAGALDNTQESVDDSTQGIYGNFAYVTQSAAAKAYPTGPNGLPDDGFFPANDRHPPVRLAYRNSSDGDNARRIMANSETYTFDTGSEKFSELHLFMAAGQGNIQIQIHLDYDGIGVTSNATVPDWFNEVPSTGGTYYLIDGMDRMKRDASLFENRDDAAIFGLDVTVDSTYALKSVRILRSAANPSGAVLTLFGAVGVRAKGDAPPSK